MYVWIDIIPQLRIFIHKRSISLRTFDTKKREKIVEIAYKYEPIGIRFREIKRGTGLSNDFITSGLKHLVGSGIFEKDKLGIYHLTKKAKDEYETGKTLVIAVDTMNKRNNRSKEEK